MVSTPGLTRSNGSVSQAGKSSTASAPRKRGQVVGEALGVGGGGHGDHERVRCRRVAPARRSAMARAGSGTASTALGRPEHLGAGPGSSRSEAGRSVSDIGQADEATGAVADRLMPPSPSRGVEDDGPGSSRADGVGADGVSRAAAL